MKLAHAIRLAQAAAALRLTDTNAVVGKSVLNRDEAEKLFKLRHHGAVLGAILLGWRKDEGLSEDLILAMTMFAAVAEALEPLIDKPKPKKPQRLRETRTRGFDQGWDDDGPARPGTRWR